jgi:hypothetical protein
MKTKRTFLFLLAFLTLTARDFAADLNWRYQLLEGSFLVDECLICGRPTFNIPMRGSFNLRRIEATPIATRYVIENATFQAGTDYSFTGSGTYETSGDFVLHQTMTLTGELTTLSGTVKASFTNNSNAITRRWPMLAATLVQTNGTLTSTITLTIAAAPLQEIWFSTTTNFVRAIKSPPDNTVSDGDLLSTAGRIVKYNSDFQAHFPGPTFQNIGLDAVDLLPGAEIAFSAYTKGVLSDGDYAYASTGQTFLWQDLLLSIAPNLTDDPGLDALQIDSDQGTYFSVKTNITVDSGASVPLNHGDILLVGPGAPQGGLYKSNADLLAQFHPDTAKDYGLDALYIWPSGEIWFSTSEGFNDTQLGAISDGDLLSDAGYIIYRNADLTAALQPAGTPPTDFGLDAVAVITDFTATDGGTKIQVAWDKNGDTVTLSWKSQGKVFRVERARDIAGPWEAISPIIPELSFQDADPVSAQSQGYYRVRQW